MIQKITKRPEPKSAETDQALLDERAVEQFLNKAPDGVPTAQAETVRKGVKRGKREQISHTITPELLQKVDARARQEGQTRAGLINLAIARYVNS